MSSYNTPRGHRRLWGTASGLALLVACTGAAAAQTTAGSSAGSSSAPQSLEMVTVTAQYIEQNLQKTPLAITAVTGQDLEARGVSDLSQLTTSIPSLNLTKEPAAFGSGVRVYIRGIGQYDTSFAQEPGVGMYIDDIYYGTLFGTVFDLLDLNRVEVLKGPQGVLGGKNNFGGAIRMVSQRPTDDNSGYLEAGYGAYNAINVKGAVNLTVIPDHLFVRLSGVSRSSTGYVNIIDYACANPSTAGSLPVITQHPNCKIGTMGGTDVKGARLAVRAVVFPGLEDTFTADVIRDDSEQQPDVLYAADPGADSAWPWPGFGAPGAQVPAHYYDNDRVYFNRGNGVEALTRTQFYGVNSDGAVGSNPGTVAQWNNQFNLPTYGIPWDQRFIPQGDAIYKTSYLTNTSSKGLRYTDGAKVHAWGLSNLIDWDIIDRVHLKLITGYRYYESASGNDSDVSPLSYQMTTSYPTNREFQQEGRFTGTLFDDKLEWTAGLFYYNRTNHQHGPVTIDANYNTGSTFLVFEQNDKYETENKSVYLHAIYHLFDNLEVFGGWRYTKEAKTFYFDHSGVVPGYPFGGFFRSTVDPTLDCNLFAGHFPCNHAISPALAPHTSRTNRPDWRAGLDYNWTDDIMTYVQFSTGYRTGGTNSRPFSPYQLDNYGPEQMKSYEVGAKTDWFNHRLRFNASFYLQDVSHTVIPLAQQDPVLPFLPYVKYVNLGSSEGKGFELEVTAMPIDNLVIDANFAYNHSNSSPVPGAVPGYLDGCSVTAQAAGICPQVAAGTAKIGSRPILVPQSTFHIGAQYTLDLSGAGQLTPRLDYAWQDTVYSDANNNPFTAIGARGLLDGRITWDAPVGGWSASFSVQNIADKKYFLDLFNLAIFGQGSIEGQPGAPRTWLFTVRKNF